MDSVLLLMQLTFICTLSTSYAIYLQNKIGKLQVRIRPYEVACLLHAYLFLIFSQYEGFDELGI